MNDVTSVSPFGECSDPHMRRAGAILFVLCAIASCRQAPPVRQYTLVGQVVAVAPERNEITIKHEDVKNFMPGMTMPFKVEDPALIRERAPGDLVTATLVVGEVGGASVGRHQDGLCAGDRGPAGAGGRRPEARGHGRRRRLPGSGGRLAPPGRLARAPRRADVHLHPVPAARVLPADGPAFRRGPARNGQGAPVRRRQAGDDHDGPRVRYAGGPEEPRRGPEGRPGHVVVPVAARRRRRPRSSSSSA